MSKWISKCEEILTSIGLPYNFERMDCDTSQLPDNYIVYFLVDDPGVTWAEGKETSHEVRVQLSLFYRKKPVVLTVPDQIEAAFMAANFMRGTPGTIPYQNDTGHYGWRCDFRLYEHR